MERYHHLLRYQLLLVLPLHHVLHHYLGRVQLHLGVRLLLVYFAQQVVDGELESLNLAVIPRGVKLGLARRVEGLVRSRVRVLLG